MATFLLPKFQFVLLIGILLLFLISRDVRRKFRIPRLGKKYNFFSLLVILLLIGNLLYFLGIKEVYFMRIVAPLMVSFFFIFNWKILGFLFVGLGMLLNSFVMLSNGLKMPILPEIFIPESRIYVPISENTRFPWLGDIFKIEDWYGIFVFSIGDIFIYFGGFVAVLYLMCIAIKGTFKEEGAKI